MLHISGTSPSMIRVETNYNNVSQVSGIEFGIPAFLSAASAKIISTTIAGNKANLQFYTCTGAAANTLAMTIDETQNVNIAGTVTATGGTINGGTITGGNRFTILGANSTPRNAEHSCADSNDCASDGCRAWRRFSATL